MVSHLHPQHPTHWVTGTAAPCTSLFKPVWLDAGLPDLGPDPDGTHNPAALFWRHELLHRLTMKDYTNHIRLYQSERDQIEAGWADEALSLASAPADQRRDFSSRAFQRDDEARQTWLKRLEGSHAQDYPGRLYRSAWHGINLKAGFKTTLD
jgi:dipeptidase